MSEADPKVTTEKAQPAPAEAVAAPAPSLNDGWRLFESVKEKVGQLA